MQPSAEERIAKQTSQYKFPYHWLPNISALGVVAGRSMQWALEYCGYMTNVAEEIRKAQGESVIDIGCGDGRLGSFLCDQRQLSYLGVDISSDAISFARIFNPLGRYCCARPSAILGQFDVAVAVEVLEHIPDETIPSFLADVRSILNPGGVFIVSVPTTVRNVHPKHFRHYDETLLAEQFNAAGFLTINMYRVHRDNVLARACQIALTNRYFSLNPSRLTKLIWAVYTKYCMLADRSDGAHIIAIAASRNTSSHSR